MTTQAIPTITIENLMVAVIRATMSALTTARLIGGDAALDTFARVMVALGQSVEEQLGESLRADSPDAEAIITAAILQAIAAEAEDSGTLPCGHTEAEHAEMRENIDPEALVKAIFGDIEAEAEAEGYVPGPNLYL